MIELLLQADRLLTVDLVDQAEAAYRRAAAQDPRSAPAVVGLARCALARGDDQGAYLLALQARQLDPDDDMARRMATRMAEVLTVRGEALPVAPQPPVATTRPSTSPSPRRSHSWLRISRGPK